MPDIKIVEYWDYHNNPRSESRHVCSDGRVYNGSGYFAYIHELRLKFSEVDVKDIDSFCKFVDDHGGHVEYLLKCIKELNRGSTTPFSD